MKNVFAVATATLFLCSCGLAKAIDYSFYVPEHGEYEINGRCFGIEDQPGERLLTTDCGGYINVLMSTITLGLLHSSERTSETYRDGTKEYLKSKYEGCEITSSRDLGGRIFEFFYRCESRKKQLRPSLNGSTCPTRQNRA